MTPDSSSVRSPDWIVVPGTLKRPGWSRAFVMNKADACVLVGFHIESDGTTSGHQVPEAWGNGAPGEARRGAILLLSTNTIETFRLLRYELGPGIPERKRDFRAMPVSASVFRTHSGESIMKHCAAVQPESLMRDTVPQ